MEIKANNAILHFYPNFIKAHQQKLLFYYFLENIAWQQDQLHLYGKDVLIPRLQAWFGGTDVNYGYSGLHLQPHDWLAPLVKLKQSLTQQCQVILQQPVCFNSALANLYRDNNDAVAWHSDDEAELGVCPAIASVSLGCDRIFKMKHNITRQTLNIPLTAGSLLIMAGETQHYWQHAILRSKKPLQPRINLTFRELKPII